MYVVIMQYTSYINFLQKKAVTKNRHEQDFGSKSQSWHTSEKQQFINPFFL